MDIQKKFLQSIFTVVVSTEDSRGTYWVSVNNFDMHGTKRTEASLVECAEDQATLDFVEECGVEEDDVRVHAVIRGHRHNLYSD